MKSSVSKLKEQMSGIKDAPVDEMVTRRDIITGARSIVLGSCVLCLTQGLARNGIF